jgi:hypothetical protein
MGVSQRQPPPHQPGTASTKRSQSRTKCDSHDDRPRMRQALREEFRFAQVATGSDFEQIRALNELTRLRATGTE